MQDDPSTGYVGPDRRRPVTDADVRPYLGRAVLVGIVVVAAWCLLVLLARHQPPETRQALIGLSRALSAALLLAAAALRFSAWRLTGTARAAWSVIVFAVAGLSIPVVGMISRLPGADTGGNDQSTVARGMIELTLICLGAVMLMTPTVVSRLRPLRMAAPFLLGCLAVAGIIAVRGTAGTTPLLATTAAVLRWLLTCLWFALAVAYVVLGTIRRYQADRLIGYALLLPTAGSLAQAILGPLPYQRMVVPAAAVLFVAVLIAGVSAAALWNLQTGRGTRLLAVAGELHGTRLSLEQVERDQARRVHDARSALLAVSGAARLLARPESSTGVDPEKLHQLVTAELHRLGAMLDPAYRSADRSFSPAAVIEPLVLAHRLAGAHIDAAVTDQLAVGKPEATATAVANVLSNARTHAPGARIWVTLTDDDEVVHIRITDNGPGIRPVERQLVLQYGVRGSTATGPGSGIGLAAAAEAMSDQGGSLSIDGRPGGGTVITLTLRRDRRRPAADQAPLPSQRRAPERPERTSYPYSGGRPPVTAMHTRVGSGR